MVLHLLRTPWCVKDLLQAGKAFLWRPALIPIVGDTRHTERGAESVCAVFINFSTLTIINWFFNTSFINVLPHYHYIISIINYYSSSSPIIISSSHRKHSKTQYTRFLRGNPSPGGKTTEAFIIIIYQQQLEGGNNPLCYKDFNSPATTGRRLHPPGLQATTWRKP